MVDSESRIEMAHKITARSKVTVIERHQIGRKNSEFVRESVVTFATVKRWADETGSGDPMRSVDNIAGDPKTSETVHWRVYYYFYGVPHAHDFHIYLKGEGK